MNKLQLTWKNLKMLKKTTGYKRLSPLYEIKKHVKLNAYLVLVHFVLFCFADVAFLTN